DDAADDDLAFRIGLLDLVPDLHLFSFFTREDDVPFAVFGALEQHVDDIARLNRDLTGLVEELVDRDDAFRFVADVDDHFRRRDLENRSFDDLAFRDVAEAVIVAVEEFLELVWADRIVIVARPDLQAAAVVPSFGDGGAASGRTGSVLVFYVRHALRVLLCRSYDSRTFYSGCRRWLVWRGPAPRRVSLNSDKHQSVRHLSPNCQDSERTKRWPNAGPRH